MTNLHEYSDAGAKNKLASSAQNTVRVPSAGDASNGISWRKASGLPIRWGANGPLPVRHERRVQLALKRGMDVVLSALGLLALGPLLLIVAVLIKATSPGPVFFRQPREGYKGSTFVTYKFRTMRVEAGDASGVKQTRLKDPRVTPIGQFLRRTSIDELPQLLNVLIGDMSLVGPRPHVPGMLAANQPYRALVRYYDYRLNARPGITGWAQVQGWRGPTTSTLSAIARVEHDVAYIQNFSLWLDIKILVSTIAREFLTGSGS